MRSAIRDRVGRGDKGQRLGDHLVSALHAGQHQGHVQGIGAADAHHGSGSAGISRHIPFESVDEFTHAGDESGVDTLVQVFFFVPGKGRGMQRYEPLCGIGGIHLPDFFDNLSVVHGLSIYHTKILLYMISCMEPADGFPPSDRFGPICAEHLPDWLVPFARTATRPNSRQLTKGCRRAGKDVSMLWREFTTPRRSVTFWNPD